MNHQHHKFDDEASNSELLNKNQINLSNPATDEQKARRKKIIKWGIIIAIITIIVVLAIVLPLVLIKKDNDNPTPPGPPPAPVPNNYNPYVSDPTKISNDQSALSGIITANVQYNSDLHQQALRRVLCDDPVKKLGVDPKKIPVGKNNPLIKNVKFTFDMISYKVAHLSLTDNDQTRYSIPEQAVPKPNKDQTMRLEMLGFSYNLNPFSFTFTDVVDPSNVYLTTQDQSLVMMDKFIQMDFKLPSQRIFGFGERVHDLQLGEGAWTMWSNGQAQQIDQGKGRGGTYGVHPFILIQGKNKNDFFGMYFRNSNAQTPVIKFNSDGTSILSYITIGGQIDAYFFIHGTPKDVIQQYHNILGGKINLPPFWALGWQQASQKYKTQSIVTDVIDQYNKAGINLEAIYLDLSYLKVDSNFQVDTTAFPDLKGLSNELKSRNQKLIVLLDSSITVQDLKDPYYQQGNSDNIFIKSMVNPNIPLNGNLANYKVNGQNKKAVYVDWFNDKCLNMWKAGINSLQTQVPFDGLWLNFNEPTAAASGEIKIDQDEYDKIQNQNCKNLLLLILIVILKDDNTDTTWYNQFDQNRDTSTFFLPFIPGYFEQPTDSGNYDYNILSLNATHNSLGQTGIEYNVHPLYGHMQAMRTSQVLSDSQSSQKDNRQFILSRSTFASSGKYASHWLGDNQRSWDFMKQSIAGIQAMNMFGIPHVGADVCGFVGTKRDDEMCARWIQLAAFYPLARMNQNDQSNGQTDERQEPYLLQDKYKAWATTAIQDRYKYLRHLYTCLFEVSQWGGTCIDPLFYAYPDDDNVYEDQSSTFLVGGALKITPVLKQMGDQDTFTTYFPKGEWVNLGNLKEVKGDPAKGKVEALDAFSGSVNVHLRPGSMIPWQDKLGKAKTTTDLIQQPISLIANRDENGYAYGTLFLDKGQSVSEISNNQYEYYQINFQSKSVQMFFGAGTRGSQDHIMDQVLIANAPDLSNTKYACYLDHQLGIHQMDVLFADDRKILRIAPKQGETLKFSDFQAIHYSSDGELNLCDPNSYQYKIADGNVPDLSQFTKISILLNHTANTLPQIQLTLRIVSQSNIANIQWQWAPNVVGKRQPVDVPQEIINTNAVPEQTQVKLSSFFSISDNPFQVNVKYRSVDNPSNVFSVKGMIYDEYLNWISAQVNADTTAGKGIFGLGERANKDFFFKDGVYSMHSRDQPTPDEDGQSPGKNMYGVHPFFMYKHKSQAWVGVLYKIGNSQDWYIKNNAGSISLNTIATGGLADIYIMQATKPDQIVSSYYQLIGNPVMIPQWALGWNQCRWGYKTIDDVQYVVAQYKANDLPLDVQWSDIDYLRDYRDFEYDYDRYSSLPQFVQQLKAQNMHYVPILDAGIAYRTNGNYSSFQSGAQQDIFMKTPDTNQVFIGQVWPNDAAYPDYFNPKTATWWQSQLDYLQNIVNFDGLWEDMNEASNFCFGTCYYSQEVQKPVKQKLKYTPTQRNLEFKSMPLDTKHANGYQQIDTHNYYGTQMVKASHDWFFKNDKRTFIIERSSFAGMGKYGSRWLGDNFSDQKFMGYSVSGTMLMNIFGIPMTGADICGFIGDTTPELCARWHVLGSFYPFSRNHNNWGQISQEPYTFKGQLYEPGVEYITIMRNAIKNKYMLLRYYYSCLMQISLQGSGTFFKPLFFEFPEDDQTYSDITYNVMLGPSLKLSINSDKLGQNTTSFYFPSGLWCHIYDQAKYPCFPSTGQSIDLPTKAYDVHLHIRQGAIVPMQDVKSIAFSTSADLQKMPIDLHILGEPTGVGSNFRAAGVYFNDDGLTLDITHKYNAYSLISNLQGSDLSLQVFWVQQATDYKDIIEPGCSGVNQNDFIKTIYYYNAKGFSINANYIATATLYPSQKIVYAGQAKYDSNTDRLVVTMQDSICLTSILRIDLTKTQA